MEESDCMQSLLFSNHMCLMDIKHVSQLSIFLSLFPILVAYCWEGFVCSGQCEVTEPHIIYVYVFCSQWDRGDVELVDESECLLCNLNQDSETEIFFFVEIRLR